MTQRVSGIRRFGSAALDMAWVAAGRFDGFWERSLNPWDVAAGILEFRDAGVSQFILSSWPVGEELRRFGDEHLT